jgi:hypothetical protein
MSTTTATGAESDRTGTSHSQPETGGDYDCTETAPGRTSIATDHCALACWVILGSSPMVEGIPAFFAAGKYGVGLIAAMAVVFAISMIAVYVLPCVY